MTDGIPDEDTHRNALVACADQLLSDSIDKSTLSSVWYIHDDDDSGREYTLVDCL